MLTRFACRSFAVLLLLAGVAVAIHLARAPEGYEERDSHQIALDNMREIDAEVRATRDWHRAYVLTTAGADAESKLDAITQIAEEQAAELDEEYEDRVEAAEAAEAEENSNPTDVGPIPDDCDEYSGNRATGCTLLLDAGFDLDQMPCLDSLWTKESGWNELASNPSSGAYGIPQAWPGDKMSSFGSDWETNPVTQILWGLDYISRSYTTPCAAWDHSEANGYY